MAVLGIQSTDIGAQGSCSGTSKDAQAQRRVTPWTFGQGPTLRSCLASQTDESECQPANGAEEIRDVEPNPQSSKYASSKDAKCKKNINK